MSYTDFAKLESCLGENCDKNLLSLLQKMLHSEKRKRGSAKDLLEHRFVQQGKCFFETERKIFKMSKRVDTFEKTEKVWKGSKR